MLPTERTGAIVTTAERSTLSHRRGRTAFLDTLFPPRCVTCRARRWWLCPDCIARVQYLPLPVCGACGHPIDDFTVSHGCAPAGAGIVSISAVGLYAGPLRDVVHALKYKGRHGIAAPLAGMLAPRLAPLLRPGDLLVPVPLHPRRQRERGYNQSAILATELRALLPFEKADGALVRCRPTIDQTTLSGRQRVENMRAAFAAHGDLVRGRRVWVLDDVCTTGATLRACAAALQSQGAGPIFAAVVAMTGRAT